MGKYLKLLAKGRVDHISIISQFDLPKVVIALRQVKKNQHMITYAEKKISTSLNNTKRQLFALTD